MLTLLFDGIAYGMLLFILAVGLSVTMGLMNFINLAHGAFAMLGGYLTVVLMQRAGVPFLLCLPLAFGGAALADAIDRAMAGPSLRSFPPCKTDGGAATAALLASLAVAVVTLAVYAAGLVVLVCRG